MSIKRHIPATIAVFLILQSASLQAAELACNQPLFGTDLEGSASHGSKDALIEAVNKGTSLRIGWGLDFDGDGASELVHWADAEFLTVWEGEVYTQVGPVHAQTPIKGQSRVEIKSDNSEWRGSIGTNGILEGRFDGQKTELTALRVETLWCSEEKSGQAWVLLYRNGADGEDLEGSKQALFSAIRAGLPIQIGWGLLRDSQGASRSVEHLVAPVFVTITNGSEVTAQLPEHIGQESYWDADAAFFDNPSVMWRGLMATTGTFDAVWVDRATGITVRRSPQRAALSWYAPASAPLSTASLAVPGGVRLDEERSIKAEQN
ncbi:MAG: hypothetical protein AAF251_06395 [Pseudomonadota bacterium]